MRIDSTGYVAPPVSTAEPEMLREYVEGLKLGSGTFDLTFNPVNASPERQRFRIVYGGWTLFGLECYDSVHAFTGVVSDARSGFEVGSIADFVVVRAPWWMRALNGIRRACLTPDAWVAAAWLFALGVAALSGRYGPVLLCTVFGAYYVAWRIVDRRLHRRIDEAISDVGRLRGDLDGYIADLKERGR